MKTKTLIIFLIILIILGIVARFACIDKDITAEESVFVKPALGILKTGSPQFYYDEQKPFRLALWHPPMYIFSLALVMNFFSGELGARLLNVIFSILTAGLIFLFCLKIIKKQRGILIGLIASAFFLINYYVLSSSMLIDIDILSCFFLLGFIYFVLRYYQTEKDSSLVFAGIFLLFAAFNRPPMAAMVFVFIGIYYLLNKDLRKDFKKYLITGIIAVLAFMVIWSIYSLIIEPGNFFTFVNHSKVLGSQQFTNPSIYIASFLLNIAQFIRLSTFPVAILFFMSVIFLFKEKSKLVKILLIYVLSIFLFFILIPRPAFGYPRYFIMIFPGISILVSIFLYKNFKGVRLKKSYAFIAILSFIISIILLIQFNPQATIYASNGLIKATSVPDFLFNILACLPLIFVFLFKDKKKALIIILIALTLSYCLFFNIKYIQHDSHIKEAAEYIKQNTNENEVIIAPEAIGYYAERRFYINDNTKPEVNLSPDFIKKYIQKSLENPKMDDEFFWPKGFYVGFYDPLPNESDLKKASYVVLYHSIEGKTPEKIIGDFYIYNISDID